MEDHDLLEFISFPHPPASLPSSFLIFRGCHSINVAALSCSSLQWYIGAASWAAYSAFVLSLEHLSTEAGFVDLWNSFQNQTVCSWHFLLSPQLALPHLFVFLLFLVIQWCGRPPMGQGRTVGILAAPCSTVWLPTPCLFSHGSQATCRCPAQPLHQPATC